MDLHVIYFINSSNNICPKQIFHPILEIAELRGIGSTTTPISVNPSQGPILGSYVAVNQGNMAQGCLIDD